MIYKCYYNIGSGQWLDEAIKEYEECSDVHDNTKFNIMAIDELFINDDYQKKFTEIIYQLIINDITPENIIVSVASKSHSYSTSDWQKFKEANDFFAKMGIEFGFDDMKKNWTIDEVENANSQITQTAKKIKNLKLSPYEKLLATYLDVTNRVYKEEDKNEHPLTSRSVFGVLNSDKIVCVGYSELVKAIVSQIGDNNIKVYGNSVAVSRDNKTIDGYHYNLIVYIKDEKYGIDGYYYCDPTWDSVVDSSDVNHLSYFLVPLNDISKIKYHVRAKKALESKVKEPAKLSKFKINSYHYRWKDTEVSFTSDGSEMTKSFLLDFIKQNPSFLDKRQLKEKTKDVKEQIEYYHNYCHGLKTIVNITKDFDLSVINYYEFQHLRIIADECIKTGSFDKLIEFENKMQEKYDGKNNVNYIDSIIKKYKDEYKISLLNDLEYSKEEIKKFEEYLTKTVTLLEEKLMENPETAIRLKAFDESASDTILKRIIKSVRNSVKWGMEQDFVGELQQFVETINTDTKLSPNVDFEESIKIYEELEQESIAKEKIIIEGIQRDWVDNIVNTGQIQAISDMMYQKSSAIGLDKLTRALCEVLVKKNPDSSILDISKYVLKVIDKNTSRARRRFKKDAQNGFAQRYIKQTQSQKQERQQEEQPQATR